LKHRLCCCRVLSVPHLSETIRFVGHGADWLERSPYNAEGTGSSLPRSSYCVGTSSMSHTCNCSAPLTDARSLDSGAWWISNNVLRFLKINWEQFCSLVKWSELILDIPKILQVTYFNFRYWLICALCSVLVCPLHWNLCLIIN